MQRVGEVLSRSMPSAGESLPDSGLDELDRQDRDRNWPVYWQQFWTACGAPHKHLQTIGVKKPFAGIDDRDGNLAEAIKASMEFSLDPSSGLYLWGPVGCGKTLLAVSILHGLAWRYACQINDWYIAPTPPDYHFASVPHLLQAIRSTYSGSGRAEDIIDGCSYACVLVLDDIGAESATDWVRDVLYQIVDTRYTREVPTVFTSNLPLDRLEASLGERIADRVVEMCAGRILRIESSSYRLRRTSEGEVPC